MPQQNGHDERKHRHIMQTGLTMFFNANDQPPYGLILLVHPSKSLIDFQHKLFITTPWLQQIAKRCSCLWYKHDIK